MEKPADKPAEKSAGMGLPPIPVKRYFTIGEVAELCGVKPHVLRYWEQEFTQLRPMKRRGNRRYYQHHEVLMIRRIRDLLYDQGFTISGARNKLQEMAQQDRERRRAEGREGEAADGGRIDSDDGLRVHEGLVNGVGGGLNVDLRASGAAAGPSSRGLASLELRELAQLRRELNEIRAILSESF